MHGYNFLHGAILMKMIENERFKRKLIRNNLSENDAEKYDVVYLAPLL